MTTIPISSSAPAWNARSPVALHRIPTLRNWLRAIAWTAIIMAVFSLAYFFDKYQGWLQFNVRRLPEFRLFKNPATTAMRVFGIPHFTIAILFASTSRRMQQPRNRVIFALLTVASLGVCWFFYKLGAHKSPFAVFLFYFYFIIHGFRDDAYFYKTYGDMPELSRATHERIMKVLQALSIGLLFAFLWPAYAQLSVTLPRYQDPILSNFFPSNWPFIVRLASMAVPMIVIAVVVLWRMAMRFPGGPRSFWMTHRPVLTIYGITSGIILSAPLVGAWTFDVYILMHFVSWLLIALFLLGRYGSGAKPANLWQWMRQTRTGFLTLHFLLAGVTLGLLAVSVYAFGRDCKIERIIGEPGFYYWTLFHVTLSFLPR